MITTYIYSTQDGLTLLKIRFSNDYLYVCETHRNHCRSYIAGVSIILWCHALYTQHYEKVRSKRERGERERGEGREGERGGGERETERDRENIIMSN